MKSNPLKPQLRESEKERPSLRFTPTAWAKLICLRDAQDSEVGGFGLTSSSDPLLVTDILLVKQQVGSVTVSFDDQAVADLFEDQVELGHHPEQFARIWIHTHPMASPVPSSTDEDTFQRVFGACHWAIMFVLGRTGQTYARLRFGVGPGGSMQIPVQIDYSQPFQASDHPAWLAECHQKVSKAPEPLISLWGGGEGRGGDGHGGNGGICATTPHSLLEELSFNEFAELEPWEKQLLLDDASGQDVCPEGGQ